MPEQPSPQEIPAEGEGGSGTFHRFPGGIGGPNEIPVPERIRGSYAQLVNEVFRLRDQVHVLESGILATKIGATVTRRFSGFLPEGEIGSGGHLPFPPHEIHEIQEINELPVSRIARDFAVLTSRFDNFERQISKQLDAITQRLDSMKR